MFLLPLSESFGFPFVGLFSFLPLLVFSLVIWWLSLLYMVAFSFLCVCLLYFFGLYFLWGFNKVIYIHTHTHTYIYIYISYVYVYMNNWGVSRSVMSDSTTPCTVAHQAPPSMEFSRQEYWSGLPFPSPGDLPNPRIAAGFPALQADTVLVSQQGGLCTIIYVCAS